MVEISFLTGETVFAALWLVTRIAVWIVHGRVDWKRELALLLVYVNLAVIIRFTFFPFSEMGGKIRPLVFDVSGMNRLRVNLHPFVHLNDYVSRKAGILNFIGNILLFIPSGILVPALYKGMDRLWKTVLAGACLSLSIELIQLLFSVRTSDVDDLILNTAGVVIGYGAYASVRALRKRKKGSNYSKTSAPTADSAEMENESTFDMQ